MGTAGNLKILAALHQGSGSSYSSSSAPPSPKLSFDDATLMEMLRSRHDRQRLLAEAVDQFHSFAKDQDFDTALTAAVSISFKAHMALKRADHLVAWCKANDAAGYVDELDWSPALNTKELQDLRDVRRKKLADWREANGHLDVWPERPRHFKPFACAQSVASSADSSDELQLRGELSISPRQNEAIQSQLLRVLEERFPKESESLRGSTGWWPYLKAVVLFALRGLELADSTVLHESRHPGWWLNLKAQALLERKLEPAFQEGKGAPIDFDLALDDVAAMPSEAYEPVRPRRRTDLAFRDIDALFGSSKERSMQARSLAMLARASVDFSKGDFLPVLDKLHGQVRALPDDEERSTLVYILASRLNEFSAELASGAAASDAEAAYAAFELMSSVLEAWQSNPPNAPPAGMAKPDVDGIAQVLGTLLDRMPQVLRAASEQRLNNLQTRHQSIEASRAHSAS